MLNQEAFIKRLHQIFKHYSVSAATFADEIKVQRSSISHLLSGRNKPSLEFILKITEHYKEISFEWLLNGKGTFPKTEERSQNSTANLFSNTPSPQLNSTTENSADEKKELDFLNKTTPVGVEKIVVFYLDGTFKEYQKK